MIFNINKTLQSEKNKILFSGRVVFGKNDTVHGIKIETDIGESVYLKAGEISLGKRAFFDKKGQFYFQTIDQVSSVSLEIQADDEQTHGEARLKSDFLVSEVSNSDQVWLAESDNWLQQAEILLNQNASNSDIWRHAYAALNQHFGVFVQDFLRRIFPRKIIDNSHSEVRSYSYCFFTLCDIMNYNNDVRIICEKELEKNGASFWYYTVQGHLAYRDQNNSQVFRYYQEAAQIAGQNDVIHFNRGIFSWASEDEIQSACHLNVANALNEISLRPFESFINNKDLDATIHFVGCDEGYLKKYLYFMLRAQISSGFKNILHIHVSNPSISVQEALNVLSNECNFKINYSFDYPKKELLRKEYYTCLRFIYAPMIKEYRGNSLIITDIDINLSENWSKISEIITDKIMGFRFHGSMDSVFDYKKYYGVPWSVNAQMSYYSSNALAKDVIEFQAKFILNGLQKVMENPDISFWTIDQVALRISLDRIINLDYASRIVNLSIHPIMARASKGLVQEKIEDLTVEFPNSAGLGLKKVATLLAI